MDKDRIIHDFMINVRDEILTLYENLLPHYDHGDRLFPILDQHREYLQKKDSDDLESQPDIHEIGKLKFDQHPGNPSAKDVVAVDGIFNKFVEVSGLIPDYVLMHYNDIQGVVFKLKKPGPGNLNYSPSELEKENKNLYWWLVAKFKTKNLQK